MVSVVPQFPDLSIDGVMVVACEHDRAVEKIEGGFMAVSHHTRLLREAPQIPWPSRQARDPTPGPWVSVDVHLAAVDGVPCSLQHTCHLQASHSA